MEALLDADIITYRIGFTTELDDEGIAIWRCNELIENILASTGADSYKLFLTGQGNFRYSVDPEYKAHRKDKPKPVHYEALRKHMMNEWEANLIEGYEADDALGIEQCQDKETMICSIDKDLNMIPGWHYNFVNGETYYVDEWQALQFFYKQLLIGDVSDNVKGVQGIGPKKAARAIDSLAAEEEMFETVRRLYSDDRRLLANGKLLWIWRKENDDYWTTTFQEQVGNAGMEDLEGESSVHQVRTGEVQVYTASDGETLHTGLQDGP